MWKSVKSFFKSGLGKFAAVLSTFPLWKGLYNLIDAWGNLQMITDYLPRIWQFLNTTAGTFVVMFVGFALVALQLYRQGKRPASQTNFVQASGTVDNSPETINATLNAKFESEKEAIQSKHESELKTLNDKIENLQRDHVEKIQEYERGSKSIQSKYATLLEQNKGLHAQLAKQSWMYNIAGKQAERINQFVTLNRIERADFRFNDMDGWPYIRFHFYILNKSVFDVIVELDAGARDSYVVFKDEGLRPEKFLGIPNNQLHIPHDSEGCLTIEQQLSAPQAHTLNRLTGQDDAIFYFDRLVINIRASHNVEPQLEEKRLVIDKAISITNDLIPMRR
jgi:hypothetical protein